jgi:translation initiation factor IF-2
VQAAAEEQAAVAAQAAQAAAELAAQQEALAAEAARLEAARIEAFRAEEAAAAQAEAAAAAAEDNASRSSEVEVSRSAAPDGVRPMPASYAHPGAPERPRPRPVTPGAPRPRPAASSGGSCRVPSPRLRRAAVLAWLVADKRPPVKAAVAVEEEVVRRRWRRSWRGVADRGGRRKKESAVVDQEGGRQHLEDMATMRGAPSPFAQRNASRYARGAEAVRAAEAEKERKTVRERVHHGQRACATPQVPATQIVSFAFKEMGLMITINQRLD